MGTISQRHLPSRSLYIGIHSLRFPLLTQQFYAFKVLAFSFKTQHCFIYNFVVISFINSVILTWEYAMRVGKCTSVTYLGLALRFPCEISERFCCWQDLTCIINTLGKIVEPSTFPFNECFNRTWCKWQNILHLDCKTTS